MWMDRSERARWGTATQSGYVAIDHEVGERFDDAGNGGVEVAMLAHMAFSFERG